MECSAIYVVDYEVYRGKMHFGLLLPFRLILLAGGWYILPGNCDPVSFASTRHMPSSSKCAFAGRSQYMDRSALCFVISTRNDY